MKAGFFDNTPRVAIEGRSRLDNQESPERCFLFQFPVQYRAKYFIIFHLILKTKHAPELWNSLIGFLPVLKRYIFFAFWMDKGILRLPS